MGILKSMRHLAKSLRAYFKDDELDPRIPAWDHPKHTLHPGTHQIVSTSGRSPALPVDRFFERTEALRKKAEEEDAQKQGGLTSAEIRARWATAHPLTTHPLATLKVDEKSKKAAEAMYAQHFGGTGAKGNTKTKNHKRKKINGKQRKPTTQASIKTKPKKDASLTVTYKDGSKGVVRLKPYATKKVKK